MNRIMLHLSNTLYKKNSGNIILINISKKNDLISYSDGSYIEIYDLNNKKSNLFLEFSNPENTPNLSSLEFTKNSSHIIFIEDKISIINLENFSKKLIGDENTSNNFILDNKKNNLIYSSVTDKYEGLIVFDIENWKLIRNIPLEYKIFREGNFYSDVDLGFLWVNVLAIDNENKLLAVAGSDFIIRIIDLETLEIIKYLQGHKNDIKAMIFSHNGNYLISGADKEELAFFWNTKTWELEKRFGNYDETWIDVDCDYNEMNHKGLSITSDDKYLIISTRDKFKITFLDTEEMKIVKEIKGLKYVKDVAISNDDKYIAYSDDYEGTVKIFELKINEN